METNKKVFSSTLATVITIVLCLAIIIAFSFYSNHKTNSLYSNAEQIRIIRNSWHSIERETTRLLAEPVDYSDLKQWSYSVYAFDNQLNSFINCPETKKLARKNFLFKYKLEEIRKLAGEVKSRADTMRPILKTYCFANQHGSVVQNGGMLYNLGYCRGRDQSQYKSEISDIVNNSKSILAKSHLCYTILLGEMDGIISNEILRQTARLPFTVFTFSLVIVLTMIFFVLQQQREGKKCHVHLEELIEQRTSELKNAKLQAETAKLRAEQVNKQLQVSVEHANTLRQQATEAGKAKNDFLANISHEIRTPMNAIIGFSEVLAEGELTDEQKEQMKIIRESGYHLLQLINDMLDFSKIESGKLNIEISDCNLTNTLATTVSFVQQTAEKKGLELRIDKSPSLPEKIRTDPVRLKQCLINLLNNAIKFTESGTVCLKASVEQHDSAYIRFDVEDTGIGIPTHLQSRIFEPFTQANEDIFRKYGGTGLGLAITKRLVKLLKGRVELNSSTGGGSTFSLIIPIKLDDLQQSDESRFNTEKNSDKKIPQEQKFTGNILVAEDSPTNQTLIKLLLKKAGLNSTIVENGRQAVDKALSGEFDLILMDIQMLIMDGYEATKSLRQQGVKIPIVALTANAMKGDDQKCYSAGCNDYLSKPIDRKKLFTILAKYLSSPNNAAEDQTLSKMEGVKKMSNDAQQQNKVETNNDEKIIDWDLLKSRVGDESLIDEIVPVFLKDNAERMEMLASSVRENNLKEVKFYAHSLKGASGIIGASRFSELAKRLEYAGREGEAEKIQPLFAEIKSCFEALSRFLARQDWKQIAKQQSGGKKQLRQT